MNQSISPANQQQYRLTCASFCFRASVMKRGVPWLVAVLLAAAAGGVAYWAQHRAVDVSAVKDARKPKSQAVKVLPVERRDLRVWADAVGTVLPSAAVTVKSRVEGVLSSVHFREGDCVAAGDLLAEIDPRPFALKLAEAQGQLVRDQALLDGARTDLARYQTLLSKDAGSRQQVDTQIALVRQYEGALAMDRASVESAQLQLSWTRITAPVSGRIGLRRIDAGNLVKAQDEAGITLITRMNPALVQFSLTVAQALQLGDRPEIQVWDSARTRMLAQSRRVIRDNQIDAATGTLRLKAEISGDELIANQFVQVRVLQASRPQSLAVHASAIQRQGNKTQVFKVDGSGVVHTVAVQTGVTDGDWIEIAAELAPGDKVVVDGLDRLRDGAQVKIAEAEGGKKHRPKP